jgi:hypothetical protein
MKVALGCLQTDERQKMNEPKAIDAASAKNANLTSGEAPVEIAFASFLESVPPSQARTVTALLGTRYANVITELKLPDITLHCTSPDCAGNRKFRYEDKQLHVSPEAADHFIDYICSNCRQNHKRFALRIVPDAAGNKAVAYKYGEEPFFGPATSPRLLTLLGDQREIFLKGRRCENQGLGIGAFGYYRRVVEHQKNRILDEIIKVSETIGASKEALDLLKVAKSETQFLKSVSLVKDALPQLLLIQGHNPLTLLHAALSSGLHEQSDEKCLELAQDVRIVLGELSDRLSQALKDEAGLNSAVGRLLRAKT